MDKFFGNFQYGVRSRITCAYWVISLVLFNMRTDTIWSSSFLPWTPHYVDWPIFAGYGIPNDTYDSRPSGGWCGRGTVETRCILHFLFLGMAWSTRRLICATTCSAGNKHLPMKSSSWIRRRHPRSMEHRRQVKVINVTRNDQYICLLLIL